MKEPTHLGDGAYASDDGAGGIWLTANHHERALATGEVFLDAYSIEALCRWYYGEATWRRMVAAANATQ
jgi:hypothetical protein